MGNERKGRSTRMGFLIDDKTNKRMSDLQTRRMPVFGDSVRASQPVGVVRHRTIDRSTIQNVTFNVTVIYDHEENIWVAECDSLGIVTEAKTFEELTKQVQDLVPDMMAANKIELGGKKPYLNFNHLEEAVI